MQSLLRLRNVFREVFGDDALTISPEMTPANIDGWDSLAHVKILLAVEEAFAFQFTEQEFCSIQSVGDLLACVDRREARAA
jgi:acyl carrier protein